MWLLAPMRDPLGLVDVPTERLEHLLRALHRGTLRFPLTPVELARHRLQPEALALMRHLRGLDASGVRAVVVAVLAERREVDAAGRQALGAP